MNGNPSHFLTDVCPVFPTMSGSLARMKRLRFLWILMALAVLPLGGAWAQVTAFKSDDNTVALWNFGEGEGLTIHDEGPLNLTLKAATEGKPPEWVEGKFGKAMFFPGEAKLMMDGAHNNLGPLATMTEVTLEAWVKLDPETGDTERAIFQNINYAHWGFRLSVRKSGEVAWMIETDGKEVVLTGKRKLPLDEWVHVAATYDGAVMKIFINGQQEAQQVVEGGLIQAPNVDSLMVGKMGSQQPTYFRGAINAIRISSKALSDFPTP